MQGWRREKPASIEIAEFFELASFCQNGATARVRIGFVLPESRSGTRVARSALFCRNRDRNARLANWLCSAEMRAVPPKCARAGGCADLTIGFSPLGSFCQFSSRRPSFRLRPPGYGGQVETRSP